MVVYKICLNGASSTHLTQDLNVPGPKWLDLFLRDLFGAVYLSRMAICYTTHVSFVLNFSDAVVWCLVYALS